LKTEINARRFAAIAQLSARTPVLDGEFAIYDQQLRSQFDWLREPDPDAVASPPVYMAFDILYRDGRDLTARPLRDRRARLEDVVAGASWCSRCAARGGRPGGVDAGGRARVGVLRRQGRGQRVRWRGDQNYHHATALMALAAGAQAGCQ
jgi:ATP dependent DNA ligase-like protein